MLEQTNLSNVSFETHVGVLFVYALDAFREEKGSTTLFADGGSQVVLPNTMIQSLPGRSSVSVLNVAVNANATSSGHFTALDELASEAGSVLASTVLEIAIYSQGQRLKVENLEPPLLFQLPPGRAGDGPEVSCAFLETSGERPRWSDEGVWRATEAELLERGLEPDGVWCFTRHLTIFAALGRVILGCTNAELFTEAGLRAVVAHKGWQRATPALIILTLAGCFLFVWLLGLAWELWSLRLGRTHVAGKTVSCCRSFLTLGPQVIKHKYTVFVVYGKDVLRCLASGWRAPGRRRLRMQTLTSAVQRFLALRTGIATTCVAQQCWNGGGWLEAKASLPVAVYCRKLEFHAGMAEDVMARDLGAVGIRHSIRRFFMMLLALHPLLDAMRIGAGSMTVSKRMALQGCSCFGMLASNSMIFTFSGSLRSWEADLQCPISPSSHFFILVATAVSMAINIVPHAFLADLAKQVHGRPAWGAVFWLLTLAYLATAFSTVMVALANLNILDQASWHASLRWSLTIKFIAMPAAQAIRHSLMLETFLLEDRKCKPTQRFPVVMGLRHPYEVELSEEAQKSAEMLASQSISVEELVQFTALLGDKVMPDYDPELCTSSDVLQHAIKPLCIKPPPLEDYPMSVQVLEAFGPKILPEGDLLCSVLHLGSRSGQERGCLATKSSNAAAAGSDGRVRWSFKTSIVGLEPEHAVGFVVEKPNGEIVGIACLSAEQVLKSKGWCGGLLLQSLPGEDDCERAHCPSPLGNFKFRKSGLEAPPVPAEASPVPSLDLAATRGISAKRNARLVVRLSFPERYLSALAHNHFYRLKERSPSHLSEVLDCGGQLRESLISSHAAAAGHGSSSYSGGFCNRVLHECLPPDRMVVHSRQSLFLQLVSTVLADAVEDRGAHGEIEEMLLERDFQGLLGMLKDAGCRETRYWIEIFAVDPTETEGGNGEWQEDLMSGLPTVLRSLRRASCKKLVADIEARKESRHGPLTQLLILDRSCCFLHEKACLAEMMLGKAMRISQRLVLHPGHLQDDRVAGELKCLAEDLGDALEDNEAPWIIPYLEDRQAVYDTVKDLVIDAAKKHELDEEYMASKLNLSDLAITVSVLDVVRRRSSRHQTAEDGAGVGDDADDLAVDVDVDAD